MSIKLRILLNSIISIIMSSIMSFVMLTLNFGIENITFVLFIKGTAIGFIITMPIGFFLNPIIEKFLRKFGLN